VHEVNAAADLLHQKQPSATYGWDYRIPKAPGTSWAAATDDDR
jgi:hypothetical protein